MALNAKQHAFAVEYSVDKNATQAAIRAGYAPKAAGQQGHDLLKNPQIQALIAEKQAEHERNVGFTAENVLREVWRLASFDVRKLYNEDGSLKSPTELDDDTAAAIQGIEVEERDSNEEDFIGDSPTTKKKKVTTKKLKWADKNTALTLAMKRFGLLVDKVEATGKDGKDLVPPSDPVETARQIAFLLASAANKGA